MRMNHINIAVSDVPASQNFLETYFGLRRLDVQTPDTLVVLSDDGGCVVTLSNFKRTDSVVYPNGFHIGFFQPTREAVDAIHARLEGDGFDVGRPKVFHGAWTFYFKAPGGFTIEVAHQHGMPAARAA